jgi:hypothetical protein
MTVGGVLSGFTPALSTHTLVVAVPDDDNTNTQKALTVTVP